MATYIAHEIIGGLYEKTVKMEVSRRLRYAPCGQAGWRDHKAPCGNAAAVLVCGKWILHSTGEVVS
jgi:hypothetical protein